MKLILELNSPKIFTLLTAPVAGGKTYLIKQFFKNESLKIVFISPLRALAEEIFNEMQGKNVYILGGENEKPHSIENFLKRKNGFLITTMEKLTNDILEAMREDPPFFVIDEFHLIYLWGLDFRPILHEQFLAILNLEYPLLGLSATVDNKILNLLKNDLSYYQNFYIHLDYGNFTLKYQPYDIEYLNISQIYPKFFKLLMNKKKQEVFLIFVGRRTEVDEMVQRMRRRGFCAIGCIGGEVDKFILELNNHLAQIDVIVATSALGHGVNLPEISKVFISYHVKQEDLWLQMIGRGGRKGSPYIVYTLDKFLSAQYMTWKKKFFSFVGLLFK